MDLHEKNSPATCNTFVLIQISTVPEFLCSTRMHQIIDSRKNKIQGSINSEHSQLREKLKSKTLTEHSVYLFHLIFHVNSIIAFIVLTFIVFSFI